MTTPADQMPRYATADEVADFEAGAIYDEESFVELLTGRPEGDAGEHLTFAYSSGCTLAIYDSRDAAELARAMYWGEFLSLPATLMARIDGRHALEWTWGDFEAGMGCTPGWAYAALFSDAPWVFYPPKPGEDLVALASRKMLDEPNLPAGAHLYTPPTHRGGVA